MSDLRTLILNSAPKRVDVPTPFWGDGVDGHVALQDIPADELGKLQNELGTEPMKMAGAILVRALIDKRTGTRIFEDADRDAVLRLGSSTLLPVFQQVMDFFGLGQNAVEHVKKNYAMTMNGSSGIDSVKPAHLVQ